MAVAAVAVNVSPTVRLDQEATEAETEASRQLGVMANSAVVAEVAEERTVEVVVAAVRVTALSVEREATA